MVANIMISTLELISKVNGVFESYRLLVLMISKITMQGFNWHLLSSVNSKYFTSK